jgi:selenocysteine-specific elongation factor
LDPAEPGVDPALPRPDPAEPRLVLGTAGHIDHGKTALIRALTGVDTDRLPEEKARGITIELGFAPLDLGDGMRLGVVDVPGHEALVRTMVAGATGIDLVLLVVAADEGVMPQTREHVAICELLGVTRGVVALTKSDAAPVDLADLAEAEVAELLATTGLADAPIVRVSSLSGDGVEETRAALRAVAVGETARTPRSGPPRLPVDRCFAMKGFGSVVTGTLVGGALTVGETVVLHPSGLRARLRGLQVHGAPSDRVEAGARCAANLQGVELSDLSRGDVVTLPDAVAPTSVFDAKLVWLDTAPGSDDSVAVELLTGTAERRARVAPVGPPLQPGSRGFARLHIDGEPLPALPGDRFVVRGFARTAMGGTTLGGGVVLDVAPPHRRRSDPLLLRELEILAGESLPDALLVRIARAGLEGTRRGSLQQETGLPPHDLAVELDALERSGRAVRTGSGTWLATESVVTLESRLGEALDAFHRAEPLQRGMPTGALRGALPENVPPEIADLALARLAERAALVVTEDRAQRPDHEPVLGVAQQQLATRILAVTQAAGLDPPSARDLAEKLGTELEPLRELQAHLEREGLLVGAPGGLCFERGAVDALRERVLAWLREHGRLETPDYKALIGTSRRSAVPLMELFDAEHLTVRRGEARVLRAKT